MKVVILSAIISCSLLSVRAYGGEWKDECVGYYDVQLPSGLEVALYVVGNITHPPKEPKSDYDVLIRQTRKPVITFGDAIYEKGVDRAQAHFSGFHYSNYKIGISSRSEGEIDFSAYKRKVEGDYKFKFDASKLLEEQDFKMLKEPVTPKEEFNRQYGFLIKEYNNVFTVYGFRGYEVHFNNGHRLYQFWADRDAYLNDKSQTTESQLQKKELEVKSLIGRFRSRELYEVPSKEGFCIPYGFIANDSGQEQHNMAVTFRLIEHPDVSIFFQTLTADPGPGNNRPNYEMSEKDYVTHFWNRIYGSKFRDIKLYGKGFTYPEIDGRKAVAAFTKFTRFDKTVDYGYVAYVKGKTPTEPTLMFYLIRRGIQATGSPPVDKKDLEKMAEHIVASIKHRQMDIHRPQ